MDPIAGVDAKENRRIAYRCLPARKLVTVHTQNCPILPDRRMERTRLKSEGKIVSVHTMKE
jgi:hypothetical protein